MKIKSIDINDFKRFTNLKITNIPESAKLVLLVGPNGSGKSSIFEAFNHWYKLAAYTTVGNQDYLEKKDSISVKSDWYYEKVAINFHSPDMANNKTNLKDRFYFRTAYRNEADFTISTLKNQSNPLENSKFATLNINDTTVSENYQRLISQTLAGVFDSSNNNKSVETYRDELIGEIRCSLKNVFEDLTLSSIGDPLAAGSFYFEKGNSKDFHYKNLSAGEKSAFDILLDLIIKAKYYKDTVFCIDEPEAHMHTRLQAKLLSEMYRLIPEGSQLWISTHSIGMLKQAEELETTSPNSVVFLNFDNRDFDSPEVIMPTKISKSIWDKFFELAIADFSQLISPKKIVFCEGSSQGRHYKNFDAQIYSKIFEQKYYDTQFISIGSCNELENINNQSISVISSILKASTIIKIVDRDDKSPEEVLELLRNGIKTLKRRHIESYLLDDEIIKKLCQSFGNEDKIELCLSAKAQALNNSVVRGNPSDDVKSASGELVTELKKILKLTARGNNTSSFLRDTMASLIDEGSTVYKELESQIFTEIYITG